MQANELRQRYIEYFQQRAHLHLPSAPLVPIDALGEEDRTTLFTGSGMQQFKPYFTGAAQPPSGRVATVQKCVRTGDIDSVGDYSHCTFFEMLGNFSFGDYFKAEVIPWTWEFLTKELGLDPERFDVTVYIDDDEAYDIWRNVIGLPEDRIHRMGEDKNYWPANAISEGPNGPCGPCSEIFYRVAPLEEMVNDPSLTPTERYKINDDAGHYVEVWNNVFTQFDRSEDETGKAVLTPLPRKNNDTGAGFDRLVMVNQGRRSVFETDLFQPILTRVAEMSGQAYGGTMGDVDFALRVCAEHTRTMVFCIADGILPSNEGRGYVLRYIMRRAIRYGRTRLGLNEPFLYQLAPLVIEQMGGFYTELVERRDLILQTIRGEEERFGRTLVNGLARLNQVIDSVAAEGGDTLSGKVAYFLYDTHGFPFELTKDIAAERGLNVDEAGYLEERDRPKGPVKDKEVWAEGESVVARLQREGVAQTSFTGYTETSAEATVLAIVQNGALVDSARAGDEVEVVLDESPFYAESGGQIGDAGALITGVGDTTCALRAQVTDTQKTAGYWLHKAKVLEGEMTVGQRALTVVDAERRRHIMRNHTATHLLQAALREVLGSHVHQKGSYVGPDNLRFDFTHTGPLTPEELERVEEIVNAKILADTPVSVHNDLPIAEAKSRGAMALFGEKYGDRVRMVEVPDVSLELCGGTHLERTSQAGLFKIASETGVGAGIRRMEAVTGRAAVAFVNETERKLEEVARLLRSNPRDVLTAVEKLAKERTELQRQVQQLRAGSGAAAELRTTDVSGIAVVTGSLATTDAQALGALADKTAQQKGSAVVVVGGAAEGKALFVVKVTPDLVQRGVHAGNLVREVAKVAGGGGGGRPDFAQAGGKDASKLVDALEKAAEVVGQQVASAV
jgi:alanyl-tRNA synthetase